MPKAERKFFLCSGDAVPAEELTAHPGSHIIGELRYVTDGDKRVSALAVYEVSTDTDCIPEELPAIRVEIVGDARGIKCTRCDRRQRWNIGKAALLQLMSRYGARVE